MIRVSVLALLFLSVLDCTTTRADGFGDRWRSNSMQLRFRSSNSRNFDNRYGAVRYGIGSYGYAGNGGFGYPGTFPAYGFGYVHDPYATGSFKAPDLLNDPFFRESTRYDSHFPGRHSSRRPPLQMRVPDQVIQYQDHYFGP